MHTRRLVSRLALCGLAALSLGWLAAAGVAPGGPCVTGFASGTWDLPESFGTPGSVDGTLFDVAGNPLFKLAGTLNEVSTPCLSCREGELFGFLDDGVGVGPDFEVRGTWIVQQLSGKGTFQATLFKPIGPAIVPVGRLRGVVDDPPSFPNAPGTFQARWGLCP